MNTKNNPARADALTGILAALAAFVIWGLSVVFYKGLQQVPASEIIAHRILWSLVFTSAYLLARGRLGEVKRGLTQPATLARLLLSSLLVSINWGVFVWAVGHEQVVEASLGYFMLPLLSVAIGFILLGERLNRMQTLSVALVTLAIASQILVLGVVPLVSLTLAFSFAFYSLVRKKVAIAPTPGLLVEIILLSLPALAYVLYLETIGAGHFTADLSTSALLVLTGPMTAVPLVLYALAVRRLRMITVGLIFYVNPTLQFLLGALLYNEAVSDFKLASFTLIWLALALFMYDAYRRETNH